MRWGRVLPEIHRYAMLDRHPDILLLHVGGNDMACRPTRNIIQDIKTDLLRLWSACPQLIVVWSDLVAQRGWRQARSVERVNKARVKVNKEVGHFVKWNGGVVVRHCDFEECPDEFLWGDGVHLNNIGIDLWSLNLQGGLETAWGCGGTAASEGTLS